MFFLKNPWPKQPPNSCQELGSMRTTLLTIYPNKMSSWRPKPTFLSGKNMHSDSHLCFGQRGMFLLTRVWRFYTSGVSQYVFLVTLKYFISNIFHITPLVRNCIPCQGMFVLPSLLECGNLYTGFWTEHKNTPFDCVCDQKKRSTHGNHFFFLFHEGASAWVQPFYKLQR